MKTKTFSLSERDYNVVISSLTEKLQRTEDKDSRADINFVINFLNSILWNNREINIK